MSDARADYCEARSIAARERGDVRSMTFWARMAFIYRNNYRAAYLEWRARLRADAMTVWRPAATAPGNTAVLVYNGETIAVGRRSLSGSWFVDDAFGFCEDGQIWNVTHWMPLPGLPR